MNDDRANDTCAEATIDDLPRDAEGRVILDPAGVVEDRDGRGITTLARGLSFEGLKAELTRIHEALDAPTRAIALQVWESAARAAAAMAPNPAANEEEPLTIRGDLGATVAAFLEAGPDLTATFPSQPSPVPASPKDAVASPSAAQTVGHDDALKVQALPGPVCACCYPERAGQHGREACVGGDWSFWRGTLDTEFARKRWPEIFARFDAERNTREIMAETTAAQTVAQAAGRYADDNCGEGASRAHVEVSAAFEAGAAWMRERVLAAAPCEACGQDERRCLAPEAPAWLTALCASDAEKGEPRHER